jgi:DNA-binding LacI/PurR family transcriptional regulator/biotin operon repressor
MEIPQTAHLPRLPRALGLITQTEQLLREAIKAGDFPSGRLPTEIELADQLGVSRETVRLATERLQSEGLLFKVRRRGTFLRSAQQEPSLKGTLVQALGYLQTDYRAGQGREDAVTRAVGNWMLQGAIVEAGKQGYSLIVRHAPCAQFKAATEQLCRENRLRGMIFASSGEAKTIQRVLGHGMPVVLLDHDLQLPRIHSVRDDSFAGAQQAVAHLASLGHRSIAYAHPKQSDLNPWRLQGYRKALREAGIRRRKAWEFFVDLDEEGARAVVSEWSGLNPRPTALYCFNNTLAHLVLNELRRKRIRVPEDLSLVGGGGENVPGLTCFQADWEALGRKAIEILLRKPARPEHFLGEHTLHIGKTSRAPASR